MLYKVNHLLFLINFNNVKFNSLIIHFLQKIQLKLMLIYQFLNNVKLFLLMIISISLQLIYMINLTLNMPILIYDILTSILQFLLFLIQDFI